MPQTTTWKSAEKAVNATPAKIAARRRKSAPSALRCETATWRL
jgi:hypothetical protein